MFEQQQDQFRIKNLKSRKEKILFLKNQVLSLNTGIKLLPNSSRKNLLIALSQCAACAISVLNSQSGDLDSNGILFSCLTDLIDGKNYLHHEEVLRIKRDEVEIYDEFYLLKQQTAVNRNKNISQTLGTYSIELFVKISLSLLNKSK